ncbi:MAG: extracellular solute-binding protein [Treponema sp.]|nr:extracellular solute-binding protein [Treponema sp.]
MIHNNLKKLIKSILYPNRIEIFAIIVLLALIITPITVNMYSKMDAKARQVNLYFSPYAEKLFGSNLMEELIREFEEKNPEIKIQPAVLTADTESLPGAKKAGEISGVDILFFDDDDFDIFAAAGFLTELSSFTNYDSGTLQLAIPLASFMDMLFYNINILNAAGFDSPPRSRDEFLAYARAVSRGNFGAYGAALSLYPNDRQALTRDVLAWIWASGGNFWPEEEGPVLNARAVINDINFLGTLNREGLLAPDVFNTAGDQRIEQFARGEIALMIASTRIIPYLRQRMGDEAFGITVIPGSGMGGKYSINISAVYAGINANSDHPDEAWKFLEFLADKSLLLCAELKAVPGMISNIIPGDYVRDDPFYSKAWDIFESALIAENFSGKPGAGQYERIFMEEIEILFKTSRTAQDTVLAIQRRWDRIKMELSAELP